MKIQIQNNVFIRHRQGLVGKPHIWFVHGFGESGFCFIESFFAKELKKYSIWIPDFPGFGFSPSPKIAPTNLILPDTGL